MKYTMWRNVYQDGGFTGVLFDTKELAEAGIAEHRGYIETIQVSIADIEVS